MAFSSEKKLVDTALESLFSGFLFTKAACGKYLCLELDGLFGRPDAVLVRFRGPSICGEIRDTIAFEAKLSNWRRGLAQAYRYKAFASRSFLVLDDAHSGPACRNVEMFRRSNIGLLSIDEDGGINVHYWPSAEEPYSEQLARKLEVMVLTSPVAENDNGFPLARQSYFSTSAQSACVPQAL